MSQASQIKATLCFDDEDFRLIPEIGKDFMYNGSMWIVVGKKSVGVGNTWSEYEFTLNRYPDELYDFRGNGD